LRITVLVGFAVLRKEVVFQFFWSLSGCKVHSNRTGPGYGYWKRDDVSHSMRNFGCLPIGRIRRLLPKIFCSATNLAHRSNIPAKGANANHTEVLHRL